MHIITRKRLRQFAKTHPDAEAPLRAWETFVKAKKYKNSHEVKADFGTADFIGRNRVIFDIGGNKYRLVAVFLYKAGQVLIRHIVTHKEYDSLIKSGAI